MIRSKPILRYHTAPVLREMTYCSYSSTTDDNIMLIIIVLLCKYFEFGFDERLQLPVSLLVQHRLKDIVIINLYN